MLSSHYRCQVWRQPRRVALQPHIDWSACLRAACVEDRAHIHWIASGNVEPPPGCPTAASPASSSHAEASLRSDWLWHTWPMQAVTDTQRWQAQQLMLQHGFGLDADTQSRWVWPTSMNEADRAGSWVLLAHTLCDEEWTDLRARVEHEWSTIRNAVPRPIRVEPPLRRRLVLSLDGGGVRVWLALALLERLERAVQTRQPSWQLHRHLDVVAGTSAGSILAIALGTAERSVRSLFDGWTQETLARLLPATPWWRRAWRAVRGRSKYTGEGKSEWLQAMLGTLPITAGRALVMVPVLELTSSQDATVCEKEDLPVTLARVQWVSNRQAWPGVLAWQLADAASQAPTYFPLSRLPRVPSRPPPWASVSTDRTTHDPTTTTTALYGDAGLTINDPVMAAVLAARRDAAVGSRSSSLSLLSLGTGRSQWPQEVSTAGQSWGLLPWLRHGLLSLLTETSVMQEIVEWAATDLDRCWRIDEPLGRANEDLDLRTEAQLAALSQVADRAWQRHWRSLCAWANLPPDPTFANIPGRTFR